MDSLVNMNKTLILHLFSTVTVQCTRDGQFIVVVSKYSTLPSLDLNSISMLGTGIRCGPVDQNSEFAIYQFPVNECGTIVRVSVGIAFKIEDQYPLILQMDFLKICCRRKSPVL